MANENQEASSDKSTNGGRSGKKEVDLFPALIDRKTVPIVAPRASALGAQISMFAPVSFEEALDIVECLRSRASTTVCLDKMRKMDAGRLVDFVSGASAAIDGDFHKLSDQVYLFCPSNVKIVAPGKQEVGKTSNSPLDYLFSGSALNAKMGLGDTRFKS